METRLATILSYILHPLLIPSYSMLLLFKLPMLLSLPDDAKLWLLGVVFAFTFLLPVAILLILFYLKIISSLEMEQSTQRTLPLMFTSACYLGLNYLMRDAGLPDYFLYILYGSLLTLLLGLIVNLFYKISLHMLGWGAATAAMIGISIRMNLDIPYLIIGTIFLSGLAGFARLKLNAHNPTQVYLGFVAGVALILTLTFVL